MKRMIKRTCGLLCALVMLVSMIGAMPASVFAVSGGGSTGTGSVKSWGCDMSYYNVGGNALDYSMVDFNLMKADGCDYVILRIGYEGLSSGLRNQDPAFVGLYNRAREAGMKIGVYYYTCRMTYADAAADAQWCINIMQANNMYFEYPIYYDVEYPGTSTRKSHEDLNSAETTSLCLGWAETLANAGYFPGTYAGIYVLDDLQSSYTNNYDTWIAFVRNTTTGAQYNPASSCTPSSAANPNNYNFSVKYGMWQYKWYNSSWTPSYNGSYWKDSYGYPLDCNVSFKDYPTIMQTYGYNNMVTRHAVTFESNGGSAVDTQYVVDGKTLTQPANPSRYGFEFGGWYCNPELTDPYDFSSPVPYDFTLYAKWNEGYWGANTNLMPNSQQLQLNNFNDQGAIWPYFNDDAYNSVTMYNGVTNDENWSWPSAYMAYENSVDATNDKYIYVKKDGNAYFNAIITYMDKDGGFHDVYLSELAGNGSNDFAPGYDEFFVNFGDYVAAQGHTPASGNVKFTRVTYFTVGAKDSYVKLYDMKFTTLFDIEDPYMTLYNSTPSQSGVSGSFSYNKGVLNMTSTSEKYSLTFDVNKTFNPSFLSALMMDVTSTVPFDVMMNVTTANGEALMNVRTEFFNVFGFETCPERLPAGTWKITDMNLAGYYEWNGGAVSESTIKSVTITLYGAGDLSLAALQASRKADITYLSDTLTNSGSLSANTPDPVYTVGDVNNDGEVSTSDARLILNYTVGVEVLTAMQIAAADFDGDGEVTTTDARDILMSIVA